VITFQNKFEIFNLTRVHVTTIRYVFSWIDLNFKNIVRSLQLILKIEAYERPAILVKGAGADTLR
jgi:hypothetical protein